MKKIIILVSAILFSQLAGVIGSLVSFPNNSEWYNSLEKPFFQPPNWLFGPVWIILYTLIGVSIFLIIIKKSKKQNIYPAIFIFFVQWILNAMWSILFFGLERMGFAFVDIILLMISIILMMVLFYRIYKPASWILLPYLVWVIFATILNGSLLWLN